MFEQCRSRSDSRSVVSDVLVDLDLLFAHGITDIFHGVKDNTG
jgi:hypothetical protein